MEGEDKGARSQKVGREEGRQTKTLILKTFFMDTRDLNNT